jgi:starch phosphorylase
VEIAEAVGEENCYIFGLREHEVEALWRTGYDARTYYRASPRLRAAVDRLYSPIAGRDFSHIADYLIARASAVADPYMCLADFESYRAAFDRAVFDYDDGVGRAQRSLVNIARSGWFSSERSIREYAERIWHLGRISG